MSIKLHKKYQELFRKDSRFFIVTGGRGSSKSYSVAVFLVRLLLKHSGHKVLFTRYTLTAASKSIIPEFIEKIELLNALPFFEITQNEIKCKLTGSSIIFSGIKTSSGNQTANLKSLQGVTTWVLDEAEELDDELIFDKINLSVRQKGVQNRVILIMNPSTKEHWIFRRFFEEANVQAGSNTTKGNTTYIHTTYLDNLNNLDESFLLDIERIKNTRPLKYKHQILGGWLDRAEGVIFTDWSTGDAFPEHLTPSYGQDFGFSNDPTTLVKVAIEKDTIYVQEIYGKTQLSTNDIYQLNKAETNDRALIVADSAEPRLISELRRMGNNIKECIKGQGSITAGISLLQNYHIKVIDSPNIVKELNNYAWHDKKSGVPVDAWNHCFIGSTLIETTLGPQRIDKIKIKDLVYTSQGPKEVLKIFDNGKKQVFKYLMQFDTFSVYLICTPNHKIKTKNGWIEIAKLKSGTKIYLTKNLMVKNTIYTQERNILVKAVIDYIELFGLFSMVQYLKACKYIIRTITQLTTILPTWNWLKLLNTWLITQENFIKKILILQESRLKKIKINVKHGIKVKKVINGIKSMVKNVGRIGPMKLRFVKSAERNIKHDIKVNQDFAITTARLVQIEEIDLGEQQVYDLMVNECHEYLANGVLVHNCIDAIRYIVSDLERRKHAVSFIGR